MQTYQMTKPAPIVWPSLISPKPERTVMVAGKSVTFKSAYEATFMFTMDHPDWVPLRDLMRSCLPAGASATYPVEDGTKIADEAKARERDREWARGKIFFRPHSNVVSLKGATLLPPRLVAILNNKYVGYASELERVAATPFFYSGVLAIGTFGIDGYTGMGGGVTAYLNEVLSLNSGERIAGGLDPESKYGSVDKFDSYVGHVSAVDPTAGIGGLV